MKKALKSYLAKILAAALVLTAVPFTPGSFMANAEEGTATVSELTENQSQDTKQSTSSVIEIKDEEDKNLPTVSTGSTVMEISTASVVKSAAFDETVEVGDYTVTVTAPAGVFPDGARLSAVLIEDAQKKDKIKDEVSKSADGTVTAMLSFDIKIMDETGTEIQPDLEKGTPMVTFGNVTEDTLEATADAKDAAYDTAEDDGVIHAYEEQAPKLQVYHLDDALTSAEKLDTEVNQKDDTVKADGEHFSTYTIVYATKPQTGEFDPSDYNYEVAGNTITLGKYTGTKTELYVPGTYKPDAEVPAHSTNGVESPALTAGTEYQIALKAIDYFTPHGDSKRYPLSYSCIWTSTSITSLCFGEGVILPEDCLNMFNNCDNLENLDVSKLDTTNVTCMGGMFNHCRSLKELDLSNFDTSKVTDMGYMFSDCTFLKSLDLSNFNTSQVTDMSYMFYECSALTSLDVSMFDTSLVITMEMMFKGCSGLTSLDLSNFNTSKVTTMRNMFFNCIALTSLDLSKFDIKSETETGISDMLSYCKSLMTIKTPKNCEQSVRLPKNDETYNPTITTPKDGGIFYNVNDAGTEYTVLPTSSLLLVRDGYALISYEADDPTHGTVSTASEIVDKNAASNTLQGSTAAAKDGYHFASWLNAGGAVVSTETKFVPAKLSTGYVTATYTAYFAANNYKVSFSANGGTGSMNNLNFMYGTEQALTANSFTRDGFTFTGWNTDQNGKGTAYNDGAPVKNLTSTFDATVTLYAQWAENAKPDNGGNTNNNNGNTNNNSGNTTNNNSNTTNNNSNNDDNDDTNNSGSPVNIQGDFVDIPAAAGTLGGTRFQLPNGNYLTNQWAYINNTWRYFDSNGYMQLNWLKDKDENWYYLDPGTGVMKTGLLLAPDGHYYYFYSNGVMAVGDVVIDGVLWHFNGTKPNQPTYTLDANGQWIKNSNTELPYGAAVRK